MACRGVFLGNGLNGKAKEGTNRYDIQHGPICLPGYLTRKRFKQEGTNQGQKTGGKHLGYG